MQCSRNMAERLLEIQLSELETSQFEEHLSTCTTCQDFLVEAAGGASVLSVASALLGSSAELSHWTEPNPGSKSASSSESSISPSSFSHTVDLSILGPTDDPNYMGRIGNYEVQGIIGRGGMGVVFRALDRALSRNVAIKVLDPSMASIGVARQRFAMEARAMAAISHEHVVPVYTVDEHRGLPYFAMEYVPGGTLESRIRHQGSLDLSSVLQIARQIALALSAAHESGLVHRDIKPANILLDRGVERVRVTDFGLARVNSDVSYTRSGFIAGTPQFMAPEQVRGEICTEQSDLFSLGSVMYAMCTGHSPFRCESMYGAMQRVVHEQPRSIRDQTPNMPEWLELFIFKLLSKAPEDRFENATMVANLLEQEIAHANNPSSHPTPVRAQYGVSIANKHHSKMSSLVVLLATIVAIVAIVAVGSMALFVVNRNWEPDLKGTQSVEQATSLPPMWANDGTQSAQTLANQLEQSYIGSDPIPVADRWKHDVRELQHALDGFELQKP